MNNDFYKNFFWKVSIDLLIDEINKLSALVIINNKYEYKVLDIFYTKSFWKKIQFWLKLPNKNQDKK